MLLIHYFWIALVTAGAINLRWGTEIPGMSADHPHVKGLVGTSIDKEELRGPENTVTRPFGNLWNPSLSPAQFEKYRRMAMWSAASYCEAEKLKSWSCGPRCDGTPIILYARSNSLVCALGLTLNTKVIVTFTSEQTDTVGFVGTWKETEQSETQIVVAFRGSVSLTNWYENLRIAKEPTPWPVNGDQDCKVHEGFLASYMDVQRTVREAVSQLMADLAQPRIIVTGHSLGGAIAQICAADLKSYLGRDASIELVTFHAPRVGNLNFSQAMHQLFPVNPQPTTKRFTNRADPMSHLPPYLLSYVHLAGETWVTLDNRTMVCNPEDFEDPNCQNSVWPDDISNHFYIWNVFFGTDCSI